MNKQDIDKIKRNIKHNNDALLIHGIGVYYVSDDKKVHGTWKKFCEKRDMSYGKSGSDQYWDLIEEDRFINIMKKSISGSIGQTLELYNIEDKERLSDMKKLIASNLDEGAANSFAEYIAETLNYTGSYTILLNVCELTHRCKAGNGFYTDDDDLCDSECTVHKFLMTSICPMEEIKIGLYYDKDSEKITHWDGYEKEVSMPVTAFLYPTIEDGYIKENQILLYNKNKNKPVKSLVQDVFKQVPKATPKEQKQIYSEILKEITEDKETKDVMSEEEKELKEEFITKAEALMQKKVDALQKDTDKAVILEAEVFTEVLKEVTKECDYTPGCIEQAEEIFTEKTKETPITADNVLPKKKYQKISVDIPVEKLETLKQVLNGKECLVIPLAEYKIDL